MVDMSTPLTAAQLAEAKAEYQRACDVLRAHLQAEAIIEKQALAGRYFKHIEHPRQGGLGWPVYLVATALVDDRLTGWHFQQTTTGEIAVTIDTDLQASVLNDQCVEVSRAEFVTAYNALLTEIARFVQALP